MALIIPVRGFHPTIGRDCFLAENATIIGDVVMGDECSVWFNTVLRGDVNSIRIGNRVNIQDGSVLHTLYQKSTIEIGDDVSIGHNVTIHGAKIRDYALVGMGAVVMDDAEVGEGAIVAAGAVVLSRTKIGPNELWAGAPAKFIKMVDPAQSKEINQKIAHNYLMYSRWYTDPESNRGKPAFPGYGICSSELRGLLLSDFVSALTSFRVAPALHLLSCATPGYSRLPACCCFVLFSIISSVFSFI